MDKEMEQLKQEDFKRADQLQSEFLEGIVKGEAPERLLLKEIECIALRDGDTVSGYEAKENIKAIYGIGLGEKVPLEIELEELQERLHALKESLEKAEEKDGQRARIQKAILAHEEKIAFIQKRIS